MSKRRITPGYVFFYILFLPDTWQILIGLLFAYFVAPYIIAPDREMPARVVFYIMIAIFGYAASRKPGRWISKKIRQWVLKKQK